MASMDAAPAGALRFGSARGAARRAAFGLLIRAFPVRTAVLLTLAVLSGVLPAVFAALVGWLIASLPGAVAGGFGSAAGHRATAAMISIGVVLIAQELLDAAREIAGTDLRHRFDQVVLGRVMAAATRWPDLELFDNPDLAAQLDRARRVAQYGPGEFVSGLRAQTVQRSRGIASTVLLAYYFPYLGLPLAVIWLAVGDLLKASYYRANPFWADPLRRARYFQLIGLMPAWAKELRIFGLTAWVADRFSAQWLRVIDELRQARRADHRSMGLAAVVLLAGNAAAMAVVVHSAWTGALGIGALVVVMQAMVGMSALAGRDGDIWMENGAVPVPAVRELERTIGSRSSSVGARAMAGSRHSIRFDDISFSYADNRSVFDGFTLDIAVGTSLAVVGVNGAGKTTLVKLLTGLCRPQRGRVLVDGIDIADVDPDSWRQQVAAIFQDFVRYELPARDNVAFGAVAVMDRPGDGRVEGADGWVDERVRAAVARAGAESVVDGLPAGLDTVLSARFSGGVDLSGGQWQRMALARALLAVDAGAAVLVLDEPTAHLDVRAEADLFDRFLQMTAGLTTVLISHRFSTVRRADRIVVLDGGRVVEAGTHDELVAEGGRYARMFRLQAERYVDADG